MNPFKVYILGCSSATPTERHLPSCQVIEISGRLLMIDCGEGAQRSLRLLRLNFSRLTDIFISHLHGDHSFGLLGLLSTLGFLGRKAPLNIYGPQGLDSFVGHILEMSLEPLGYEVLVHELPQETGIIALETRSFRVSTLKLQHRVPAIGYVIEEKRQKRHIDRAACDYYGVSRAYYPRLLEGEDYLTPSGERISNERLTQEARPPRRYAYMSDTTYQPQLIPYIKGVTMLYHEATFLEDQADRAHQTGHSTAREAAMIAKAAGVGELLIGHYSARYREDAPFGEEAARVFEKVSAVKEGEVYILK